MVTQNVHMDTSHYLAPRYRLLSSTFILYQDILDIGMCSCISISKTPTTSILVNKHKLLTQLYFGHFYSNIYTRTQPGV